MNIFFVKYLLFYLCICVCICVCRYLGAEEVNKSSLELELWIVMKIAQVLCKSSKLNH